MEDKNKLFSVAAVIVTYNRLEKLKIALEAYEKQTLLPKFIIVVNNCSSDGTKEYLQEWLKKHSKLHKIVINTKENLGGSGGFYLGQKQASELDVDWIYLADDDAYPESKYFEKVKYFLEHSRKDNISAVCGKVRENNNDKGHCAYLKKWSTSVYIGLQKRDYNKRILEVDATSYIGVFINKKILLNAGFANKDYFIWQDDIEHFFRLSQYGKIICLTDAIIIHDATAEHFELSWKYYYLYRNRIDLIKKHLPLQAFVLIPIIIAKAILCPLKGKSFVEQKLRLIAIKDGIFGNLGKHPIYKPGWKP